MDFKKITDFLKLTTPYKDEPEISPEKPQEEKYYVKQEPLEELFTWKYIAPKFKIPKKILRSGLVFASLFAVFLVLAQDWVFLLVVLGMIFIINILINSNENRTLEYKIYNNGFDYSGNFYSWAELERFFYYEGTDNLIVIDSKDALPGRIYVYFASEDKEKIDNLLNKYLAKSLKHPKDFYEYLIFKVTLLDKRCSPLRLSKTSSVSC
jgi:hypothetical protein